MLRLRGQRRHPRGVRAGRPGRVPDRGRRRGRPAPGHPAPVGHRHDRGPDEHPGHPRRRPRRPQRLRGHHGPVRHRRRRSPRRHRSADRAVAEALSGLRHRCQPDQGARRTDLTTRPVPRIMQITAVVIGAGHAGLAMSSRLTERSIDHVVLERGQVANSWRTGRWQSLLPGHDYTGDDPDGFMPAAGVVATLTRYAGLIGAPVRTGVTVHAVRTAPQGFQIQASNGVLNAPAVVLATGACNLPAIPPVAAAVPPSVTTLTPLTYRGPGQLPGGGVLVVGASATGVQLAAEIHHSGRPVTLAAGEHVRLPRTYRGRDIFWWLQATGLLAERYDQIDDLTRARHLPSPQLTGAPGITFSDLNALTAQGVRLVGRLGHITGGVAQFSGSLANTCTLADLKMNRFLNRADQWATATGLDDQLPPPHRFVPTHVDPRSPLELDLTTGEITTVLWATGFRPDHSWLHIPVCDRTGRIRHDGGVVTGAPGLYLLGMPVLRTRASTYIHGAATDSQALAGHLHSFLGCKRR